MKTMPDPAHASNDPASAHQVLWLPCLPAEGSLSMDRYWIELDRQRRARPPLSLSIRSALPGPPGMTRRHGRLARFVHKYLLYPRTARREAARADLVHVLDHAFANLLRHVPAPTRKVVTVHDLAPLRSPGELSAPQLSRFRRSVEHVCRADLVLADSRHTARDVVELLGCDETRVRVFPLGADLDQFGSPQPAPLPDWAARFAGSPVILSVGSVAARKNLEMLPEFCAGLQAAGWPVTLVRIGDPLPAPLVASLRTVLGARLYELGKVPPEQLAGAYQRAAFLIFPSKLEGFGLPVIEAMAAGCPVVSSNASSLPEVGGEAALYFDPADPAGALARAGLLLGRLEVHDKRVRAGKEWVQRFSWHAHFAALMDIYSEVLEQPGFADGKSRVNP